MLLRDVTAILRAEGSAPVPFPYRRDDYALQLLLLGIGGGWPISDLRQGPFRRLLEKPAMRQVLAGAARGVLAPRHLVAALVEDHAAAEKPVVRRPDRPERETFWVTLERWGASERRDWESSYYQTSRPGQNLVVQLNFPSSHDRAYERLVRPEKYHPFAMDYHPVRMTTPYTLAWARLDIDQDAGEVLVEEVQCDWVRDARSTQEHAELWLGKGNPPRLPFCRCAGGTPLEMLAYFERVLAPYASLWAEGVLAAAIAFSYERLGIRRIYFHTFDGGNLMKRLRCHPPRSLYTDLPQRFCFVETKRPPAMLSTDRRVKLQSPSFYVLELV